MKDRYERERRKKVAEEAREGDEQRKAVGTGDVEGNEGNARGTAAERHKKRKQRKRGSGDVRGETRRRTGASEAGEAVCAWVAYGRVQASRFTFALERRTYVITRG